MRIIAGTFRSRHLKATPPPGIRPTSDKLRETLFNVLGPRITGARFLDAFAGMGGVGIEAISRGASFVCFVDQSRKATNIIRENLRTLNVTGGFRILEMELGQSLDLLARDGESFDVAFLDPPYERQALYAESLAALGSGTLLNDGGVLVIEHSKRVELPETQGSLVRYRVLTQGDSTLSFYRSGVA
jgi:16S rRNA (guanine(966)-N(2))-methyltransferase RsmD